MDNVVEMELILTTLKIVGRLIYNNASYLRRSLVLYVKS